MFNPIKPQDFTLKTEDGDTIFVLSRIPAIQAREIITQYPITAAPRIGDYKANENLMRKLMAFVGVRVGDTVIPLTTDAAINNHCPSFEDLAKLEWAMIEYNTSFLQGGKSSNFLKIITPRVKALITEMLTASSAQSSLKTKPPSQN